MQTSKIDPSMVYFMHFDLDMCFAPQWRALFEHLNFSKWSQTVCFWHFWLGNVLPATTASTFSTSQIPKVVRRLVCCRFSDVTFRPSGATNHWKKTKNRDFPTFSRTCLFFLLALSLLWYSRFFSSPLWLFPPLPFHLAILPEVWLRNFGRWYWTFDEFPCFIRFWWPWDHFFFLESLLDYMQISMMIVISVSSFDSGRRRRAWHWGAKLTLCYFFAAQGRRDQFHL